MLDEKKTMGDEVDMWCHLANQDGLDGHLHDQQLTGTGH